MQNNEIYWTEFRKERNQTLEWDIKLLNTCHIKKSGMHYPAWDFIYSF